MPSVEFKVVCCEGGDQVGKADAMLNFSKKLFSEGIPVTYSSFPIYASPFGAAIRLFLKRGLEEFKLEEIKELKVKMALYALDRLQFVDVLLSDPKYAQTVILLDRSSFSNAVTIAYGCVHSDKLNDNEINSLIGYHLKLEEFMIGRLGLGNCVIELITKNAQWSNVRDEKNDINENIDVQTTTNKIYDLYQKRIGRGWKKIITKTAEGWRSREGISSEMVDFVKNRYPEISAKKVPNNYTINIQEVLGIYKGADVAKEDIDMYWNALNSNDKDTMHDYGIKVALCIGSSFDTFELKNPEVKEAFGNIIKESPEVLEVISVLIDKNLAEKVKQSLD